MSRSLHPHRLLMTADCVGGVWTYALELARALGAHRVEVALAVMGRRLSPAQRAEVAHLENVELFESDYKLEWMEDAWGDVLAASDWLLDLEARLRPDLVHLNSYAHGALPWRAPKVVVGHSCVLSWWRAVHGENAPAEWQTYREGVTAGLHASDLVIAPSAAMLGLLEEHYGPFGASMVIFNGRSLPSLPLLPKEPFIFTAGRLWDAAKNVAALAAVAPELPWPIYVAGDCQSPGEGATELDHVTRLGRLSAEELTPWFARASIFAMPARYEPFGLSALEAALAGCALVLGDIPSLREVWGDAAVFVPPNQPEALQAALQGLIANPTRVAELGDQARAAAARYTPERMSEAYLAAYAQVMKEARLHKPQPAPSFVPPLPHFPPRPRPRPRNLKEEPLRGRGRGRKRALPNRPEALAT